MQITTKGVKLMLVEVPMEACRVHLNDLNHRVFIGFNNSKGFGYAEIEIKDASINDLNILGTLDNGVPDFDVEPYVEVEMGEEPFVPFYKPYGMNDEEYAREIHIAEGKLSQWESYRNEVLNEKFLSLLKSHSIDYNNKKLICLRVK